MGTLSPAFPTTPRAERTTPFRNRLTLHAAGQKRAPLPRRSKTRFSKTNVRLRPGSRATSFVSQDLHRQDPRGGAGGDQCCADADGHGGGGNPYGVQSVGTEGNERDRVHLRVQRD